MQAITSGNNGGTSIEDSMVITGMQIQSSHMRKLQKTTGVAKKGAPAYKVTGENSTDTSFRPNKFGMN
jgi:hypothetical protein